jgi:hypothetical protein
VTPIISPPFALEYFRSSKIDYNKRFDNLLKNEKMKKFKFMWMLGAFTTALTLQAFTQDLPEVTVYGLRHKYLSAVDNKELARPVKMLERRAAEFDVKSSDYYEEEYDTYFISFYIPDGEILATYDKDGKLLSTVEKYKNVALPQTIAQAVVKRFPNWTIPKDVYLVNYNEQSGSKKVYKITLENADKRLKIKVNDKGEFI